MYFYTLNAFLSAPAALGRLLHREQVFDGFPTNENTPSSVPPKTCYKQEKLTVFLGSFLAKGSLEKGQLISLCGVEVGDRKR